MQQQAHGKKMYTFCLLFSYLIKVVALLIFICCYQHVLVNKDIQKCPHIRGYFVGRVFRTLTEPSVSANRRNNEARGPTLRYAKIRYEISADKRRIFFTV